MAYEFKINPKKLIRVIIDTDAACEADDQFAVVHALLTPKFVVRGIIAEQFNKGQAGSVGESFTEIKKLLDLMSIADIPVFKGIDGKLESEDDLGPQNEAVDFIIREAMTESELPLYIFCQGAATNVAAAINRRLDIAGRIKVIWIGGAAYPNGGWEFNLTNDHNAANSLFKSEADMIQVPMNCYITVRVGYAELEKKVRPCGSVGKYLFDNMMRVGLTQDWVGGESWALGDSPCIALAIEPCCGVYKLRTAPRADEDGKYSFDDSARKIMVCEKIDQRFLLEDFFAKLSLNYNKNI